MTAGNVLTDRKIVLVTGATGRQGGATARELLRRGWPVRALTRDPTAPAAQALQAAGAQVVPGDLEDRSSLASALEHVYGVFSVQNYWGKGIGYPGEIRQARNLAEEARAAGVQHLVQASIVGCEDAPGVEHFASKHEVEKLIGELGLPCTFLRAVFFMDNFTDPKVGGLMFPVLSGALRPERRFHMIATEDIGRFAADAFTKPAFYLGRTVEIAGDALTVADMKAVYQRATGKRPPGWHMPAWALRLLNAEMAKQLAWNNDPGWSVDVEQVRSLTSTVTDFETFLRRHQAEGD